MSFFHTKAFNNAKHPVDVCYGTAMDSMEPQRRSIQDIIPPARSRPLRPSVSPQLSGGPPAAVPPSRPTPPEPMELEPEPRRSFMKLGIILAVTLFIVAGGIALASTLFHRAYVTVTPQRFDAVIQDSFTLSPDSSTLPYQKVVAEDTLTKAVPATGSKQVSDRASGTIIIYNAYSTASLRLITNTQFASPDGLIYRIHTPVSIPGYTTKAGLKVPGSLEATVYADNPGDKYNVGLTDFTVPKLKEQAPDLYALVYARSKTPMTGGFVGQKAVVNQTVRNQAIQDLKTELDRTLRAKISENAPPHSFVFDDTIRIIYTEGTDTVVDGNAVISVSGSAVAPALDETMFANALARSAKISYQEDTKLENPNDLDIILGDTGSAAAGNPLTIRVSGTAKLIASFSIVQLAQDLAAKSKDAVAMVQTGYPGIASMDVQAYPFWLGSLPSDPAKIRIEVVSGLDQVQ